jgi:hypothetical protein
MGKMLALAFVAAAFGAAAHAAPAATPQPQPAPAVEALADLVSPAAATAPAALPNCGNYEGNACTTPGAKVRCQWAPYEPGLCFCNSAHIWVCG